MITCTGCWRTSIFHSETSGHKNRSELALTTALKSNKEPTHLTPTTDFTFEKVTHSTPVRCYKMLTYNTKQLQVSQNTARLQTFTRVPASLLTPQTHTHTFSVFPERLPFLAMSFWHEKRFSKSKLTSVGPVWLHKELSAASNPIEINWI